MRQHLGHVHHYTLARRIPVEVGAPGKDAHQLRASYLAASGWRQQELVQTHQTMAADDLSLEGNKKR